jgi:hypothetical protein
VRVRVGSRYRFERAGWDLFDGRFELANGTVVKVINLPGAPPANAMGHCYIGDKDSGEFIGMVSTNSLVPVKGRSSAV